LRGARRRQLSEIRGHLNLGSPHFNVEGEDYLCIGYAMRTQIEFGPTRA
jgi:hypothetical protein